MELDEAEQFDFATVIIETAARRKGHEKGWFDTVVSWHEVWSMCYSSIVSA